MPTLKEILDGKTKLLDNADDVFHGKVKGLEKSFLRRIQKLLERFNLRRGRITNSKRNRRLLNNVDRLLDEGFKEIPLTDEVSKYLKKFDLIDEFNRSIYEKTLTRKEAKRLTNVFEKFQPERTRIINDITKRLTNTDVLNVNIIKPVRDILFESVIFERTFAEADRALREEVLTVEGSDSRLLKYTRQITTDALNQSDGATQDIIRSEYDLDGFAYIGSLIKTSRLNCVDLINGTGIFKDLSLGRGKYKVEDIPTIISRARGRAGFNPATTPETFAKYRMGFNCRHHIRFIRLLPRDLNR